MSQYLSQLPETPQQQDGGIIEHPLAGDLFVGDVDDGATREVPQKYVDDDDFFDTESSIYDVAEQEMPQYSGCCWLFVKLGEVLRSPVFWLHAIPCIIFFGIMLAVLMVAKTELVLGFPIWRYFLFLTGVTPIHFISKLCMKAVVMFIERNLFNSALIYLLAAIKRSGTSLMRQLLYIGYFFLVFRFRMKEYPVQDSSDQLQSIVLKLLVCSVLFSTVNVAKSVFAKLIATQFHQSAHMQKMEDAIQKEHILWILSQYPVEATAPRLLRSISFSKIRTSSLGNQKTDDRATPKKNDDIQLQVELKDLHKNTHNPQNQSVLAAKLVRMERHLRKHKLKSTVLDQIRTHKCNDDLASEQQAKQFAFYLFWHIKGRSFDRNYIQENDLRRFMSREMAEKAMQVLDQNQNGQVTAKELRDTIIKIYHERKNLAASLSDTKSVIQKLENILGIALHAVAIFGYLGIFNVDILNIWLTISSIVLAFVFVFGNQLKTIYESVVFLFTIHPYDVGDQIMVNGAQHEVGEVSLQYTVLHKWDGSKIWMPNQLLMNMPLHNISMSRPKVDLMEFRVDVLASTKLLEEIEQCVIKVAQDYPKELNSEMVGVYARVLGDPLKIGIMVFWEYRHSGSDLGRLSINRSRVCMAIAQILRRHGIYSFPSFQSPSSVPAPLQSFNSQQSSPTQRQNVYQTAVTYFQNDAVLGDAQAIK